MRGVTAEVEEPFATGVALGAFPVVTKDTEFTVHFAGPGFVTLLSQAKCERAGLCWLNPLTPGALLLAGRGVTGKLKGAQTRPGQFVEAS